MGLDLEKAREILKKYYNPDFASVKGRKLVLALAEVAGCPKDHNLTPKGGKCNRDCYECWRLARNKE